MLAMDAEFVPRVKLMGFVSYQQPWIHFKRNVDEFILYIIKSGELHLREDGADFALRRGDAFLLEPNLDHEGTQKHVCDYYYIHFTHQGLLRRSADAPLSSAERTLIDNALYDASDDGTFYAVPKQFSLGDAALRETFRRLNEMLHLYRRKHHHRTIAALKFSELLIEMSREYLNHELQQGVKSKARMKVNALLDYIHQNYTNKMTGADIERIFECNYDYLNRMFRRMTGYTIVRYMNLVRIQHAKELIEATHLPVGEIGYLTGLEDPYYFSKLFKKYTGLSPLQYYKKMRVDS
ncbi:AraC family transcriptional regulator [Paenibacillus sp.]|uniref:AraC family transcriptional regulator n=1 Tax=Paenibacillus sp. TaxID=58172 RepID=UPI002D5A29E1|nr:AraC family transcriptional regulator [Paenibacillus sp.]HZG86296.1 AraC family transcriptional regulator [Paenibacillus sp.]